MWLVIGLGNPGARYAATRHNAGFRVIEVLSQRWSIRLGKRQHGAEIGKGTLAGRPALLARPPNPASRSIVDIRRPSSSSAGPQGPTSS